MSTQLPTEPVVDPTTPVEASDAPVEEMPESVRRARLILIVIGIVLAVMVVLMIALMVFLGVDAYNATVAGEPSAAAAVVRVIRDAVIVFAAMLLFIVAVLLIVLMAQLESLLVLLQTEIQPMLKSVNETLTTVKGTTQFVSHRVVTPVMKFSGYLAGIRQMLREIAGIKDTGSNSPK